MSGRVTAHPPTRVAAPSAHPPVSLPASGVRLCDVEGCDRLHHARGCCRNHYARLVYHGDPLGGVWPARPNPWAGEHPCPSCGSSDWTMPAAIYVPGTWRCTACSLAFSPAPAMPSPAAAHVPVGGGIGRAGDEREVA